MCGIAGVIGWVDEKVVAAVERMSAAQAHRGPDDCGMWSSTPNGHGAAFGFRRLSILDLSPLAHQPMVDSASGNVLVFNGEIYNYKEIRAELIKAGERLRSSGDTEALLKAYTRWGPAAVNKLRGMFSFAVWDAKRRCVLLARDRIGIKPLYYCGVTWQGHALLLFASELRAMLASGLVQRKLDSIGLRTYMWNGFVAGEHTMVEGVRLLPAGAIAEISLDGSVRVQRYWSMPRTENADDSVEHLADELNTAARQHLESDVPLGVFLSGGIDSSAVAALATKVNSKRVRTFNISFDEPQFDESQHALAVANALGTEHSDIRLTQSEFRQRLPEALASLDQPTFDGLNTYFVSRAVRDAGITVALAGTGGDELFGGYRTFVENPRAAAVSRIAAALPVALRREAASVITKLKCGRFGEVPPQSRWGKLADLLATSGNPLHVHQVTYGLFTADLMHDLVQCNHQDGVQYGLPQNLADELTALSGRRLDCSAVSRLELACYIGQRLLRDTDSVSMACSLEVRVPLLDHEVIEAAMAVEPNRRFKPLGKKQLLRDLALNGTDSSLFDRPKSGFVLPIEIWCHRELRRELDATLEDRRRCEAVGLNSDVVARVWRSFKAGAPGIYWSRVWSLFVLLDWCRRHGVTLA